MILMKWQSPLIEHKVRLVEPQERWVDLIFVSFKLADIVSLETVGEDNQMFEQRKVKESDLNVHRIRLNHLFLVE